MPFRRFGSRNSNCSRIEYFSRNSEIAIVGVLPSHLRHLFLVGGDPDGSTLFVFDIRRELRPQLLPKLLGVTGQRKLGLGIIHHHDVSHAGSSGAAPNHIPVDDSYPHPLPGAFVRASRPHDAGPNYNHIVG